MMEMAGDFVHYGGYMRMLATAPPVDGQSSNQQATGDKASRRRNGKKRMEVSASATQPPAADHNTREIYKQGMGSSFLKMFLGNVSESLFLPRGYIIDDECVAQHWLTIFGPSGAPYRVWLESYLDTLVLRDGWSDLMAKEGVKQGDIGLFRRLGALEFSLTIYGRGGLEKTAQKPDSSTPTPVSEAKWDDVQFIAATGLRRSAALVSTLFKVWVNDRHPMILYAATIKSTSARGGPMNLNKKLSTRLPAGPATIGLKFNGSRIIFEGTLVKRADQVSRIQGGWADFAQSHKLRSSSPYVFKFTIESSGWELTLYEV